MDIEPSLSVLWPPPVTVKKHQRARHIRFRASLSEGLLLIVPPYFNNKEIPALLDKNRLWIEKQLIQLQLHQQAIEQEGLPDKIEFPALGSVWTLEYIPSKSSKVQIIDRPHASLALVGNIQDKEACKNKLVRWAKEQAKFHLPSILEKVSQQTGLTYSQACIRNQKTRWGSCSTQKTISLNYKLLFLPLELVTHTIIHELCHTVHFDHSEKFWQLVATLDPNWQANKRATRKSGKLLPKWLS